ncbi:hypothetical protein DIS24_g10496 [Lasiodiplodia hormozganensis]|uniref:NmrA-like domain-containing protein n=1 Tax=Lasiodiplodia hormozganensis TaxID=869390 RepID=A0AA39XRE3_9PEZI|nr:hypothetical protein DIS24_g10496 [Lasiodiplodia hormozganensis]
MSSTSSQPPTSILLLGAGELGTAILTSLAAHPSLASTQLTVALRPSTVTSSSSSSRLDALRAVAPPARQQSNPIAFAPLDLAAPTAEADLTSLILNGGKRFDTVICCTGFATSGSGTATSGTQTLIARAVLAAAASSSSTSTQRRRLRFFPWQFGADYDATGPDAAHGIMAEQCGVRTLLRERAAAANLDWTIVSTGMFMSFVFEEWFGVVVGLGAALKAGGPEPLSDEGSRVVARCLGSWETRVTLTDVRDIGAVVAELVAAPPQSKDAGSIVFAAGQTVSYAELADVVQKVVGRRAKVQREEWSLEYLRAELEKNPEDQTIKYRVLFGEGKGVAWDKEKTINAERNIESMGVEQWLREKLSM